MIDPATGLFEMKPINSPRADLVANIIEDTWLSCYPWPTQLVCDRDNKFFAETIKMLKNDYNIKRKPITTQNTQANAILERVHCTMGDIICMFEIQKTPLDKDNPWEGIIATTVFSIRSTVHTTLKASPM